MQGKKSKAKSENQIEKVLDCFLKGGTEGKFGRYIIDGDRLVYRMAATKKLHITNQNKNTFISQVEAGNIVLLDRALDEIKGKDIVHSVLAESRILLEEEVSRRLNQDGKTLYVGNAATLKLIGRKVSFGRVKNNERVTLIQDLMINLIPIIDFAFFNGTGNLRQQIEGWKHIHEQKPGYIETVEEAA